MEHLGNYSVAMEVGYPRLHEYPEFFYVEMLPFRNAFR
jgi:hypothetical protein